MRITLPWPYKGLSPNDRPHPMAKAAATKRYRKAVAGLAMEAGVHLRKGAVGLRVTFHAKRFGPLPDRDNCIAAFKAGQDGLADALRVNDRDLTVSHTLSAERAVGGMVVVEVLFLGDAE